MHPHPSAPAPAGSADQAGAPAPGPGETDRFRYLGQALGLFLVVDTGDSVFLIDQHAAHERILFDRFAAGAAETQDLLVPTAFDVEDSAAARLRTLVPALAAAGVRLRHLRGTTFELLALPAVCSDLESAVVEFLRNPTDPEVDLSRELYSTLACKAAVKDGQPVDAERAVSLIHSVFALPNARCPHGRPIWHRLTRGDLFRIVGREM
jgi:DNA mismatch repair protein MutL